jgi:hypothetical protein
MKFKTTIEIEVEVEASVERTVRPHGFDPGDPGGVEIERVELIRYVTTTPDEQAASGRSLTRALTIDLYNFLPADVLEELAEQAETEALQQAEESAIEAAEARRDADEDR